MSNDWKYFSYDELFSIQGGTQPPKSVFMHKPQEGYVRLLQIQDFKSDDYAVYVPDNPKLRKCNEDDSLGKKI